MREQRQAAPLRPTVVGDVLSCLGDSDLDRRDAAMLAALYMLALRRSELIEIDYETRGDGLAVLHLTDTGLDLELLRSKASQEASARIAVDRHHNPRAFAALERWIDHAKISPGTPLFRRIHPRGGVGGRITGDGVNRAIKAALARYYISTGVAMTRRPDALQRNIQVTVDVSASSSRPRKPARQILTLRRPRGTRACR
jgi:hypothetical protein